MVLKSLLRQDDQQTKTADAPARDAFPVNGTDWGLSLAVGCSWL